MDALLEPRTANANRDPLRWTTSGTRVLAERLSRQGHRICPRSVAALLKARGFGLLGRRKARKTSDRKRNEQYRLISSTVRRFWRKGQPVIWMTLSEKPLSRANRRDVLRPQTLQGDTKSDVFKSLVNPVRRALAQRQAEAVLNRNGWRDWSIDWETAELSSECIRRWWKRFARRRAAPVREVLVLAEGANSGRGLQAWKASLQRVSSELGLNFTVSHLPAGTWKLSAIEQQLVTLHVQTGRRHGQPSLARLAIANVISKSPPKATHPRIAATVHRTRYKIQKGEQGTSSVDGQTLWNFSLTRHR